MSGEGMTINFEEEIEHFKPSLEVEEVGEAQAPGEEAREIEVAETVPAFFPSGGLYGAVEDFHLIERTGGKFGLPVRRGVPALNSLIKRHEARQEP